MNNVSKAPHLLNLLVLILVSCGYFLISPLFGSYLTNAYLIFMVVLAIANIINYCVVKYGVYYTKYVPKAYLIDGKTYFRIKNKYKYRRNIYSGYRCWDIRDIYFTDDPLNNDDKGRHKYYRTDSTYLVVVDKTHSFAKALLSNCFIYIAVCTSLLLFKE
jgi:hypothetical protein